MTVSYYTYNNQNTLTLTKLEKELRERKKNFGINHFSVAETLNSIGLVCHHMMNDHETAIQMHDEAKRILEMQEQTQQNLFDLAITIGDLGNCYWKKGDYTSAKNQYMQSMQFFENCQISETHPKAKLCVYTMQYRLGQLQSQSNV